MCGLLVEEVCRECREDAQEERWGVAGRATYWSYIDDSWKNKAIGENKINAVPLYGDYISASLYWYKSNSSCASMGL